MNKKIVFMLAAASYVGNINSFNQYYRIASQFGRGLGLVASSTFNHHRVKSAGVVVASGSAVALDITGRLMKNTISQTSLLADQCFGARKAIIGARDGNWKKSCEGSSDLAVNFVKSQFGNAIDNTVTAWNTVVDGAKLSSAANDFCSTTNHELRIEKQPESYLQSACNLVSGRNKDNIEDQNINNVSLSRYIGDNCKNLCNYLTGANQPKIDKLADKSADKLSNNELNSYFPVNPQLSNKQIVGNNLNAQDFAAGCDMITAAVAAAIAGSVASLAATQQAENNNAITAPAIKDAIKEPEIKQVLSAELLEQHNSEKNDDIVSAVSDEKDDDMVSCMSFDATDDLNDKAYFA